MSGADFWVRPSGSAQEYVDVEWSAGFDDVIRARDGRGVILSMHDFEGVPADLRDRVRTMCGVGAEIVKIATMARRLSDVIPLLSLAATSSDALVVIAMGTPGIVTRICAARFGSIWTYAGDGISPGQIPLDRVLHDYRFRSIGPATELYGIVGRPINHSLSPVMHNAAFEAIGHDAIYLPLAADDADDFLEFAEALDVRGASITAPFKRDLFERVSSVDALSQRVGAINTLRRNREGWSGTNTDVPGFLAPLALRGDLQAARVVVLGAGGAARAVVVALAQLTRRITVCARDVEAAARVAALVGGIAAPMPPQRGSWDLLVNTTPVGTAPSVDDTPVPGGCLDGSLVYDLVYNPPRTRLLREAAAAGCDTISGLDMLVAQARQQFTLWTEHDIAADVFRTAAVRRLREEAGVGAV